MFSWVQLAHLANWSGARCVGEFSKAAPVSAISTDSRSLRAGDVFVALRGERFDGHDHIADAANRGAVAVITERETDVSVPQFVVKDSLHAFASISSKLRDRFTGKVVGITGSAGKSSTKEMVATLLGSRVVASPASFNNLLGVSKTLTLVQDETEYLVLEMGMNALGEIKELCEYFKPQLGVITNIGDAHVGKLGGQSKVLQAKKELFDYIAGQASSLGIALNKGDALVMQAYSTAFSDGVRQISFSARNPEALADVLVTDAKIDPRTAHLRLWLQVKDQEFEVSLELFGKHHAENIAASVAVALLLGLDLNVIRERLGAIRPASHRGEILPLAEGRVLIDESYNSNPTALASSLQSVAMMETSRRKIIVLGDMLELGDFEKDYHRKVGTDLAQLFNGHPLMFIAVGERMAWAAETLKLGAPSAESLCLQNVEEACARVPSLSRPGDVLLVKSSRGGKLDLLVEALRRNAAR